ncbi:MAG: carbohydrate kinase family protein [Lachnospiraceae bacterium]
MEKKRKVVVAGHICVDITPVFPGKAAERIERVLTPGKLVHMQGVDIHTGGAVANTGLAMKILGNDVSLMGKIGDDELGRMVLNIMDGYHSSERMIMSEDSSTSYSVVLAVPGIDRIFLHDPGANDTFSCKDLDWKEIARADLFHFGYPSLMKTMYENGGQELLEMLRRVKDLGLVTSLDMAAIDPDSECAKEDWHHVLKRVLPYVDFFVPSAEELCFMLDRERYAEWKKRASGCDMTEILTMADICPLGKEALDLGVRAVLIKCGAPGMYYRTASEEKMRSLCERLELPLKFWAGKEGFEKSYRPAAVISGTGAGDTSIAAFLSAVLRGETLEETLHLAAATGACCVAAYDALSGLRSLEELKIKIRGGWEKLNADNFISFV